MSTTMIVICLLAKFYIILHLFRIVKQKTSVFNAWVQMYPYEHKDIFSLYHYISIRTVIWNETKINNDIKLCKETKEIIVVDIGLNSSN